MKEINKRIIELLKPKSSPFSQKEMAAAIGVPANTLNSWLKLDRDIPAEKIMPICEYLNISVDYLLAETDSIQKSYTWIDDEEMEILGLYRSLDAAGKYISRKQMLDYKKKVMAKSS